MTYYCQYCNQPFVRKYGLTRHINEMRCKSLKITSKISVTIEKNMVNHIEELEKKLELLKEKTDKEITAARCTTNRE